MAQDIRPGMVFEGRYGSMAGATVQDVSRNSAGEVVVQYAGIEDNSHEWEPTQVVTYRVPRKRR
jgi:hypothetical protein